MVCRAKFREMTKNLNLLVICMLYTILKEILYRFLFLSLKIEDMSPLESIPYGKILDLSYILVKIDEYATNI